MKTPVKLLSAASWQKSENSASAEKRLVELLLL